MRRWPALIYQGTLNYNGPDTLTVTSTDSAGVPLNDIDVVNITVNSINDAPVNTAPAAVSVDEDTALAMTGPNLISVTDVDGNLATDPADGDARDGDGDLEWGGHHQCGGQRHEYPDAQWHGDGHQCDVGQRSAIKAR